ncbi:hypothetical protein ASPWEDRAFT_723944 [Aspergillus wentii DTO 134E9]|uniref:Uncharacterized protein n=1 Tax=Aspergillus wentii DTO 134E9 TaxID=1073089 RepID=A0A1L9R6Z1_ASPWE|nr:uncharacterized protein ASPWEDRAFT_723944 [Aspergillus wentii DTO 134E9]OJJ30674.1 hypothetical protein ASPWEDRAFT_723944 [Aspergillus wentii DTO 134E9]
MRVISCLSRTVLKCLAFAAAFFFFRSHSYVVMPSRDWGSHVDLQLSDQRLPNYPPFLSNSHLSLFYVLFLIVPPLSIIPSLARTYLNHFRFPPFPHFRSYTSHRLTRRWLSGRHVIFWLDVGIVLFFFYLFYLSPFTFLYLSTLVCLSAF